VGNHIFINDENQTETVGHLLGFRDDEPHIEWVIQRPDGAVWQGSKATMPTAHRFGLGNPVPFLSRAGAQSYIDSQQRSNYHRAAFRDCVPAKVGPVLESGVVCACGQIHEAAGPTTAGHGVVL
jgi:hypothetical protein